jgi:hypothetical protein
MYSTGHGSFAVSPDGSELYYVHHGRPSPNEPQRRLYTERAHLGQTLSIDAATSDRPIPSGVAPYAIDATKRALVLRTGARERITWRVDSADGAALALGNPLNRVQAAVADDRVATLQPDGSDAGTVVAHGTGRTTLTLTYQREHSAGGYFDVFNGSAPVSLRIPVIVVG